MFTYNQELYEMEISHTMLQLYPTHTVDVHNVVKHYIPDLFFFSFHCILWEKCATTVLVLSLLI